MMTKEGQIIDQRIPHWWDKWVNPSTLFALLGGLVWGIQLNMFVTSLQGRVSAIEAKQDLQISTDHQIALTLEKQTVLLEDLINRTKKLEDFRERHHLEAAEWKGRIMQNETRLSGTSNGNH